MPGEAVERILRQLQNVTENSTGWSALCPAHGDTVNSLSVAEGDDERVLIYCHAGCTFEEIVTALGVSARSLFPRKGRKYGKSC